MTLASVIMPVYNVEKYLRRAVLSITEQTCRDIELILIDDGSSDNSPAICDEFAAADSRIKVIHKQNGGCGSARNSGLDVAVGKYIFFCDADDYAESELLSDNIRLAEETGAEIVIFGHTDASEQNESYRREGLPPLDGVLMRTEFEKNINPCVNYTLTLWTRIYRRDYLEKAGLRFNKQAIGEDAIFNLQAFGAGFEKLCFSKKSYYRHYLRPGSAMTVYRPEIYDYEYNVAKTLEKTVMGFACVSDENRESVVYFYVRALSIFLGVLSEKSCTLTKSQKLLKLKEILKDKKVADAVKAVDARRFQNRSQQIKILLLKMRLYRLTIFLGELTKKVRKV